MSKPDSFAMARAVFGADLFSGPEQLESVFDRKLTEAEESAIPPFPWSEADLTAPCPFLPGCSIRESHGAFLTLETVGGTPITLDRIANEYEAWVEVWWKRSVRQPQCTTRWHLMPRDPVAALRSADYAEQLRLIPEEYEVPYLIDELLKHLLCPQPPLDPPSMWSESAWQLRCADAGLIATHATLRIDLEEFDHERPWLKMAFEPDRAVISDLGLAVSRRLHA